MCLEKISKNFDFDPSPHLSERVKQALTYSSSESKKKRILQSNSNGSVLTAQQAYMTFLFVLLKHIFLASQIVTSTFSHDALYIYPV